MREKLLQLLPEIGVSGVPRVPPARKPQKTGGVAKLAIGTPVLNQGVPGVPNRAPAHPAHLTRKEVFQEKLNKINAGTPGTPCTPVFIEDFIDDVEERAAIMEHDAPDVYPARAAATAAAYEECRIIFLNTWRKDQ